MINFDYIIKENIKKHNPNWSQILKHPYKKIIFLIFLKLIRNWMLWITNALFDLLGNQPGIDKTYLYAKDPYETKYQLLINKREGVEVEIFSLVCSVFIL